MTNENWRKRTAQGRPLLKRVTDTGAPSGSILRGLVPHNEGLRLRVLQEQPRGATGPIQGRIEIIDVGNNKHSNSLSQLLGVTTDAQEVLTILRQASPACVNVVNANILTWKEVRHEGMLSLPQATDAPGTG